MENEVKQQYVWDHKKQIERFNSHDMPEQLGLELTNHCNLDCLKCDYSALERPRGKMS